jgi:hypothetical protein
MTIVEDARVITGGVDTHAVLGGRYGKPTGSAIPGHWSTVTPTAASMLD